MDMVYLFEAEDLSGLGGRMGTKHTTRSKPALYSTLEKAKGAARDHYIEKFNKEFPLFDWIVEKNKVRSPDLLYVMYHIYLEKVL